MDIVVTVMSWVRSLWDDLIDIYGISWFFGCLFVFPIIRYFFRKFLKSF